MRPPFARTAATATALALAVAACAAVAQDAARLADVSLPAQGRRGA